MAEQTDLTGQTPRDLRLKRFLSVYNRVDGAIFAVEAAIVTAATALMTLFIFLDLAFTFLNGIRIRLAADGLAGLDTGRVTALALAGLLVVGLVVAGARRQPGVRERGTNAMLGVVMGLLAGIGVLIGLLVTQHPRVTMLVIMGLAGLYSLIRVRASVRAGRYGDRAYVIWVLTLGLLIWFAAGVPDRYSSWTQPYALFLLLWTGFIGASMATSRGRHLRIDAVRKSLPSSFLGRYNFLSYLVAATLTGVFCYLAASYTMARLGTPVTAGEIPDWLKVLAIPVALGFITLRFLARAILNLMGWVEEPGGEEELLAAQTQDRAEVSP